MKLVRVRGERLGLDYVVYSGCMSGSGCGHPGSKKIPSRMSGSQGQGCVAVFGFGYGIVLVVTGGYRSGWLLVFVLGL